ncbi:MAG: hypothetical protein U5K75_11790 [Ahrensia sp.]|nr:hypothetical protein [Ahrensia sp.]
MAGKSQPYRQITVITVPVIVNAVADAPRVANTSSTVDEDTATVVGDAISYGLVDTDGSEVISAVTVTGYSRWCDLRGNTIGHGHSEGHASYGRRRVYDYGH